MSTKPLSRTVSAKPLSTKAKKIIADILTIDVPDDATAVAVEAIIVKYFMPAGLDMRLRKIGKAPGQLRDLRIKWACYQAVVAETKARRGNLDRLPNNELDEMLEAAKTRVNRAVGKSLAPRTIKNNYNYVRTLLRIADETSP